MLPLMPFPDLPFPFLHPTEIVSQACPFWNLKKKKKKSALLLSDYDTENFSLNKTLYSIGMSDSFSPYPFNITPYKDL